MTTRHLVDPEIAPLLDIFPPLLFTRENLPQVRAGLAEMTAQMAAAAPAVQGVEVTERQVPGPAGAPPVRVLVYRPTNVPGPLAGLLWVHGGGYVVGSADADDAKLKALVAAVGCAVYVSVDYRLAPETAHPGPVEDCYAALRRALQPQGTPASVPAAVAQPAARPAPARPSALWRLACARPPPRARRDSPAPARRPASAPPRRAPQTSARRSAGF